MAMPIICFVLKAEAGRVGAPGFVVVAGLAASFSFVFSGVVVVLLMAFVLCVTLLGVRVARARRA